MAEGYGEDPAHVAAFARAAVRGLQGGDDAPASRQPRGDAGSARSCWAGALPDGKVLAAAKHFLGYLKTESLS